MLPPRAQDAIAAAAHEEQRREFVLWWCRVQAAAHACGGLVDVDRCLATAPQVAEEIVEGIVAAVAVRAPRLTGVRWLNEVPMRQSS